MRSAILVLAGLVFILSGMSEAMAQAGAAALAATEKDTAASTAPVTIPQDLAAEDVDAFVAPLTDQAARGLLLDKLKADAVAQESASVTASSFADFLNLTREMIGQLAERVGLLTDAWNRFPDTIDRMILLMTDLEGPSGLIPGFVALFVMLAAGAVAVFLVGRLFREPRARIAAADPDGAAAKLGYLLLRLLLDVISVAAFAVAGMAISFAMFDQVNPLRLFTITYLGVVTIVYLVWTVSRFIFAPASPSKRLIPMSNTAARRNTLAAVVLGAIAATGFFSGGFLELVGVDPTSLSLMRLALLLLFSLGLVLHLLTLPANDADTARLMRNWRWVALGYSLVVICFWAVHVILGQREQAAASFLSIIFMISVPAVDRLVRRQPGESGSDAGEGGESSARARWFALAFRASACGIVVALALATLAEAAGAGLYEWLATPSGAVFGGALAKIAITTFLACIAWSITRRLIDNSIERERLKAEREAAEQRAADGEGGTMVVGTRAQTLLPLFRGTIFAVIGTLAVLIVLSEIGIDIGPLLAGAGVVGLAIGFGAQALVRDVVSGVFFLIDDSFRIGEYIEIEELRGEVEKISIRSMQLRHHRGPIQTVPFGEIKSITNYNRDWVIYKQEFRVPYDTDVEKVRKLIKKLGLSMLEHPEFGSDFIEPLKSQGVRRMEDSAMIIGTKFMCKPRKQFVIRRHVFQNIQRLFQENGIEFARRRVIVEGPAGSQSALEAAAAAEQEDTQAPGAKPA